MSQNLKRHFFSLFLSFNIIYLQSIRMAISCLKAGHASLCLWPSDVEIYFLKLVQIVSILANKTDKKLASNQYYPK